MLCTVDHAYSSRQMRKPRLPTLNRWERSVGGIVRGLQDAGPMRVVARSRVGMSSAGMRAVGLAGSMLPRRGGGGIAHAEVAPGGADLVHADTRIRQALRRSAGGRRALADTKCPDWDFFAPIRGITCGASIPAVWSRPIDPAAAGARLSLSQAGEFTGCL